MKPRCYCTTTKGKPCRKTPVEVCEHGSHYCVQHLAMSRKRGMRCPTVSLFEHIVKRLAKLRNSVGRIDLTDSSKRDEVYNLVGAAEAALNR